MTRTVEKSPWPDPPTSLADDAGRLAWYARVARWAPSKHNTQPWHFLVREHGLEVWADPARALPASDPRRRELVISCGAAVELAVVAAAAQGWSLGVRLLPDGDSLLLARLTENVDRPVAELDRQLLRAVAERRTDRGPLDGTALPPGLPFALQQAAVEHGARLRLVTTPGGRGTLAALVAKADRALVRRAAVDDELRQWLREPGSPERDGVPTDHTRGAAQSYRAEFVQRDFSGQGPAPAVLDRPDVPVLAVLTTSGDDVGDWLVAGRALAAVLLRAHVAGASASYLNQPVEEPNVRVELAAQLHLTGVPQLVLRLGRGGTVAPPARRPADDVVQTAR
jgi:nitroreductase